MDDEVEPKMQAFRSRLSTARQMGAAGLSREVAMYFLTNNEVLRFEDFSTLEEYSEDVSWRADLIEEAVHGEGDLLDMVLGKENIETPHKSFENADQVVEFYLSSAEVDEIYFESVLRAASTLLKEDHHMGSLLSEWISDYLLGIYQRPKPKKGPKRDRLVLRNAAIALGVDCLLEIGFQKTRSIASECFSACDFVAEAAQELGRASLTYDAVVKIHHNRPKENVFMKLGLDKVSEK